MTKLNKVHPNKKRGRPAMGKHPLASARLPWTLIDQIEEWCATTHVGCSEAIRQLLEIGIKAPKPPRSAGKAIPSLRAADAPARDFDRIGDCTGHPDERAQGRRCLTTGPPELHEGRVDLLKMNESDRDEGK
jgi:hypothetical protein